MKVCPKCKVEKKLTEYSKCKDRFQYSCKSCNNEKYKEYRENNKEKLKEKYKEWRKENKEKLKEKSKVWRENNKEYIKRWRENNKEKIREHGKTYSRKYAKERRKTDSLFKLKCTLRGRTGSVFRYKGYKKKSKTQEMLGVSYEICKAHIERQFTKGMNWSNKGEWHIDHIIPLASAKTEEELIKLCHYSNLQPLWAIDNLKKGSKIL